MRRLDLFATLVAVFGAALAIEAWIAGSVFRYVLAGMVAGSLLCLPLLSIALLRERARRFWRLVLFGLAPLLAALLLVELGLRLFGEAQQPPARMIEDERLGHIMEPGTGGTDAWGFRNASVPDQVDALFVGDSQTWGFFLDQSQSFAALFAKQTGLSSYQMAHGDYGPVRYRELVRRGLALKPRLVIVGFYFGNDLWDAYAGAALVSAEDVRDPKRSYNPPRMPELDGRVSPNWTMAIVDQVQSESRLCGWAGEVIKSQLRGSASMLDAQPGAVRFTEEPVATMLLPDYRRPALDISSTGLRDSLRISQRCLADIAKDCKAADARCILLAIPTKEYCYAQWLRERGTPMPELIEVHIAENALRSEIFATAAEHQLELLDLAPVCIAALAAGTPIWAANADGHLMANGHLATAQAIAAAWKGK